MDWLGWYEFPVKHTGHYFETSLLGGQVRTPFQIVKLMPEVIDWMIEMGYMDKIITARSRHGIKMITDDEGILAECILRWEVKRYE
jgi:hypothetical protein